MTATDEIAALGFEAAMQRLEGIVKKLESGEVALEEAIHLYEEAQKLRRHCEEKLSSAEARIAQLQLDADGNPVSETPFPG